MSDSLGRVAVRVAQRVRQGGAPGSSDWETVEETAQEVVLPAVAVHGIDAVLNALIASKNDPYVAAVLVEMSGRRSPELRALHVTDFFSEDEILDGALSYLKASEDAGLQDGHWAWTTLWNLWDQVDSADHARLVEKLIERVPWDDAMLWAIGDGPLSNIADDALKLEIINSRNPTVRDKVARMRELIEADWPYGNIDP